MKTEIKTILMVVLFLVLSFVIYEIAYPKEEITVNEDGIKFKEEYEALNGKLNTNGFAYPLVEVDSVNPIEYIGIDKVLDIVKTGTGIIYLGYPECPWCRTLVNSLMQEAKNMSLDKIYYYNPMDIRDKKVLDENGNIVTETEGSKEYYELVDILSDYLWPYTGLNDLSIKRIYVPAVIFVKDGEVIGVNTATVSSQTDPYVELTNEQKVELSTILEENINKVYNILCDESC